MKIPVATSSDPCIKCGISGRKGCAHQTAMEEIRLEDCESRPANTELGLYSGVHHHRVPKKRGV